MVIDNSDRPLSAETLRKGAEGARAQKPQYPVTLVSPKLYRFIRKNSKSPCCDADWVALSFGPATCSACYREYYGD